MYLNKLPKQFAEGQRVLISDPMLATGGTIDKAIEECLRLAKARNDQKLIEEKEKRETQRGRNRKERHPRKHRNFLYAEQKCCSLPARPCAALLVKNIFFPRFHPPKQNRRQNS